MKYNCTREINAINKILDSKTQELERLSAATVEGESERQRLLERTAAER